jgi:hypothetical protein
LATSEFSQREPGEKNCFSSTLAQYEATQDFLALHSSEASSGGDPAIYLKDPGNLSFVNLDVLSFLERQIKERGDFLILKEKERQTEPFPKQFKLEYQLNSSGKMLESVADQQDSAVSLPFGSSKGKPVPQHWHMPQQPPYLKNSEHESPQKDTQLFWGLPSIHSESLSTTIPASGDSFFICFNRMFSASTIHESPILPHPTPPSLPEIQPQALYQTLSQSQSQHLHPAQDKAQLQSSLPILPPSPLPQLRKCGVHFHTPQSEALSLSPSEIHHLEYNVLQKNLESLWGLPCVIQKSQEKFCPPAPNISLVSRSSKTHVQISILPGDFPLNNELQKKLEHHLQKRLIQHRWGLPHRIHESLSKMSPLIEIPSESKNSDGVSWISSLKNQNSKELNNFQLSQPNTFRKRSSEMFPLEEGVGKEQGHSLEIGPDDHLASDQDGPSDNGLGCDSETDTVNNSESLSRNNSRTSVLSLDQNQLKDAMEINLNKKFEELSEGQTPSAVRSSQQSMEMTLPPPEKPPVK